MSQQQGPKKIVFTACHSGKLKRAFTRPRRHFNAPKTFWLAELISKFFCYSNSSKTITSPSGKIKTEFTSPIAKSTCPRLSDTTFLARCNNLANHNQRHPMSVFCQISVWRSKNCLEFSIPWGGLTNSRWPFHSPTNFEAYRINSLRFSEV